MIRFLVIVFLGLSSTNVAFAEDDCPSGPKIVCYYSSWAYYRPQIGFFDSNNIDTSLCTHIVYSFAGININLGLDTLDSNLDIALGGLRNVTDLKAENPCIKTILAVGGWNEGSRKYSLMVSTQKSREAFVESALRFLVSYNFDGLDLDWEYPGQRGGIAEDKENMALLLKYMHERFSKWDLEISLAVPIISEFIDRGYDVKAISQYADFVSLMAYDFTSSTSPTTGLMAPLSELEKSINVWLAEGLPKEKLILGLPSYARSYNLADPEDHGIGAPTDGLGRSGEYTLETGFLSYYELQKFLQTGLFETVCADSNCYAYYEKDWFSFDSTETYFEKVSFAVDKGLGGLMLWTLDTDDFSGIYGEKYALLKSITNKLNAEYKRKMNFNQV